MTIKWFQRDEDGAATKWEFHGRPCCVIAVGVEKGCTKVGFLKVLVGGEEIICDKNEDGVFIDLTYEVVEN